MNIIDIMNQASVFTPKYVRLNERVRYYDGHVPLSRAWARPALFYVDKGNVLGTTEVYDLDVPLMNMSPLKMQRAALALWRTCQMDGHVSRIVIYRFRHLCAIIALDGEPLPSIRG